MSEMELPGVTFGDIKSDEFDWRKEDSKEYDVDDDELLEKTPEDVVEMLGFDPKELDSI